MNSTPALRSRLGGGVFVGLCSVELFERLAYVGVRSVVPIYIMQADEPGGLHLSAADKGNIYALWFLVQSLLPVVTGGFADRYGYKRMLGLAITSIAMGYVLMAFMRDYWSFLGAIAVLAMGTALFKPSLQGALAQLLDKSNASLGWGIFYWIVNVGALIAPFAATAILGDDHAREDWRNLFLASAAVTLLNLTLLVFVKNVPSAVTEHESPLNVLKKTIRNLSEPRLMCYLMILSAFWLMMWQLWDLQPNFIQDWIDSSTIAEHLQFLPGGLYDFLTEETSSGHRIPQQLLIWINPLLIVVLVIPFSWVVRRMRTLSAMLIGMGLAIIGFGVAGFSSNGWVLIAGIAVITVGEMLTVPKQNEYLGLIAPPDRKGLYLGYANIPVGIGGALGAKLSGYLYENFGEKATLALKYLAEHTSTDAAVAWDGSVASLEAATRIDRSAAMARLQEVLGIDSEEATQLLWDTYHPQYHVWIPLLAIGVLAMLAFAVYGRKASKWTDMNI